MSTITFSIIMPCYNSAAYVENAINSVISQKYSNWELLIINDGSTDETLNIVEKYASQDNRIKVYSKENGGYATAVNYGLDRISGDYFMFMGSDDRITNNLLSEIVTEMKGCRCIPDLIGFRTIRYVEGKLEGLDYCTNFDSSITESNITIIEYEAQHPKESEIFFERDTSKCYKSKVLGSLRYYGNTGYDSDGIFSMLFSHKCSSFSNFPIDGYLWTLRADSVSAKPSYKVNIDRLNNWNLYLTEILNSPDNGIAIKEKRYFRHIYNIMCDTIKMMSIKDNDVKTKIFSLRKSLIDVLLVFDNQNTFSLNRKQKFLFFHAPYIWFLYQYLCGRVKNGKKSI